MYLYKCSKYSIIHAIFGGELTYDLESFSKICIDNSLLVFVCTSFIIQIEDLQVEGKTPLIHTKKEINLPSSATTIEVDNRKLLV